MFKIFSVCTKDLFGHLGLLMLVSFRQVLFEEFNNIFYSDLCQVFAAILNAIHLHLILHCCFSHGH